MQYTGNYLSPLEEILLAADGTGITGLWFYGQKHFAQSLEADHEEQETDVLARARQWLDVYFSGKNPDFSPPLHLIGTDFRVEIWEILRTIPYAQTVSYAEIARQLALRRGLAHLSAQAVGGAIAHNPISLLVPCHRVIRTGGDLGGYAAGVEKKKALLRLEYLPAGTPMNRILMDEETVREAIEAVYDLLNP